MSTNTNPHPVLYSLSHQTIVADLSAYVTTLRAKWATYDKDGSKSIPFVSFPAYLFFLVYLFV